MTHTCDDCTDVARRAHAERVAQGLPAISNDPVAHGRVATLISTPASSRSTKVADHGSAGRLEGRAESEAIPRPGEASVVAAHTPRAPRPSTTQKRSDRREPAASPETRRRVDVGKGSLT